MLYCSFLPEDDHLVLSEEVRHLQQQLDAARALLRSAVRVCQFKNTTVFYDSCM